jgi:N-acetylglucosaminyldiphosphoundecaprenol N-acetyl-beta-D-mannosaminyltransferase
MTHHRELLFGVYVDALRMEDVLQRCRSALANRSRILIGVVNAAKVVKLRDDPLLRNSLLECDMLLADGQSVVWASRLLKKPLPERVAGIDLFEELLRVANQDGRSVFLLGARQDVLDTLIERITARYPKLKIAGSHHGYFQNSEGDVIAAQIRESGADMLFLGMTTPKKEIFLGNYGRILDVPVLHGVGGSFDVLAGITRRAPRVWQKLGMEWAYRLLQEPRRLMWRYLSSNCAFLALTLAEKMKPSRAFRPTIAPTSHQPVSNS